MLNVKDMHRQVDSVYIQSYKTLSDNFFSNPFNLELISSYIHSITYHIPNKNEYIKSAAAFDIIVERFVSSHGEKKQKKKKRRPKILITQEMYDEAIGNSEKS